MFHVGESKTYLALLGGVSKAQNFVPAFEVVGLELMSLRKKGVKEFAGKIRSASALWSATTHIS